MPASTGQPMKGANKRDMRFKFPFNVVRSRFTRIIFFFSQSVKDFLQ
jgi:hypothetical protein